MALIIKSPYSGKPVKVRDQDVGRSLRDESGHIFYVLPTADGTDYYAAKTRVGSLKEEQTYAALTISKTASTNDSDDSADSSTSELSAYDATGKRRKPWRLVVLIIILILVLAAFCSYFWMRNLVPFEQQIKNIFKDANSAKVSHVQKSDVNQRYEHVGSPLQNISRRSPPAREGQNSNAQ